MNKPTRMPACHPFDFEPTFHRVAQTNEWNSAIACIASVVKLPVDAVRLVAATQLKWPVNGRRSVPGKLIPELFDYYDWWAASRYKTANAVSVLPDLALILLSKKPDHFVLFHRQKFEDGKPPVCYLINPAHVPVDQHYVLDVAAILPCKFLSICLMEEYMKDFW